ncbi:hypothetical protein TraAM80_05500 [Trypanosoma rangeli]|uniref:Atg6 BARA domain-containing protein n=1 Tax=Trypanosoma rangeli TaxID=5698 RepID=A0A3R7NCC3_TRYRA|nr:uncharacterized protein TraAM80_05500 [Trypanosoma rangeli]RNF04233.1 hypothetical protein TraAM80_05500 [Trypanosoma rangeli]|eukprot:RNF04233.1 hypothetical protein TraAM80_05500 [Trypanosoma rangeli]
MSASRGEGGNVTRTLEATRDGAAYAPVCAVFTCCVCRRTVQLDGKNVACHKSLVTPTARRLLSPFSTSTLPAGGFLMSSRASSRLDDEESERRRIRDRHMGALHKVEEAWSRQEEREQQTCLEEPCDVVGKRELQETLRRQRLHPAIKGSLLSAAGKYAPLAPSPLSPWLNERHALLKKDLRPMRVSTPPAMSSDMRRTTRAQSRMVTRLSPFFVYQYEWLATEELAVYIQELWRMLYDGPVPPPRPSSQLTVQRAEFCSNQPTVAAIAAPAFTVTPPSGTHQREPIRLVSQLSLPTTCDTLPVSAVGRTQSLSVLSEDISAFHPHVSFTSENAVHLHIGLTTGQAVPYSPRILHTRKITSMTPHAAELPGAANTTAVQRARAAGGASPMATISSSSRKSCPASPSREAFLSNFARKLLCLVVHKSRTDVPLCMSCWKDSLESQQKETTRTMEDVTALTAVYTNPDANSIILCFCRRLQREAARVGAQNSFTRRLGITNDDGKPLERQQHSEADNVLACVAAAQKDVVRQESLHRLQVEVWEKEEKSRLVVKSRQALQGELTALLKRRTAVKAEWEMVTAKHNAQQVVSFFNLEDAASGVSLRTQHAACSYRWMSKMHAMSLAFPIDISGAVATIAGLRLGKCSASASSRSRSLTWTSHEFVSASSSESGSAVEMDRCVESTVLMNLLYMQQEYSRSLLGSRNDSVSVAEINQACGYLLLLLKHIKEHHRIPLEKYVLRLNGEQSTVEVVSARGSPPQMTCRSSDFFICEKLFSWKTFGAACVTVASFVQELVMWMQDRLLGLREAVHRRLTEEVAAVHSAWVSSATPVLESLVPAEAPYVIMQDKVDGFPVCHSDVSEELWTLGMKKLLEVVRWCVAASRNVDELQRVLEAA